MLGITKRHGASHRTSANYHDRNVTNLSSPKDTTIRKLFAVSMNRCAFPGCLTPVIDPQTNTILAEVCHIRAQNERGPRFEASQTPDERHALENLILMCSVHHKVIDAGENVATYTVAYLQKLKSQHEQAALASREAPLLLTAELVRALQQTSVIYEQNAVHMDFRNAVFRAGGEGGALGGGGGGGGIVTIVGTTQPPPGALLDLAGKDAKGYGGGGGGAGAIQYIGRPATSQDVARGLRVSSFFTANAVSISDLFHVLGGAWSFCPLLSVPTRVAIHVVCVLEPGTVAADTLLRFNLEVLDPQGNVAHADFRDVVVPRNADLTPRIPFTHLLKFEVGEFGAWAIRLSSADIVLASYGIEFRQGTPV